MSLKVGIAGTEPNFLRQVVSPLSPSITLRICDLNLGYQNEAKLAITPLSKEKVE